MAWSRYKSEWERSMVRFRQILDSGVSRYYDHSDLLWQAFRSEVETEEVPTLDGVKAAEELVTKSNVSQYAYLKLYLVRDLETVIKGFPKWRDMVT
ncbi:hypothetical protein VNI00_013564 [Paramarasmius palmivorus]|uniref:Uncharacterized protein n=1 Tax=Paramarasmius palmivorus TaxID=297713 RepID=A0AAW0BY89_9AGAR